MMLNKFHSCKNNFEKHESEREKHDINKNGETSQLKIISDYECLGHYLGDDEWSDYGGKKETDETSFALMLEALKNGSCHFTFKFGGGSEELKVNNSKLIFTDEEIIQKDGSQKWIRKISIIHEGRKLAFKARCQVMSSLAGIVAKTYDFRETNRDGVYEQVIFNSDVEDVGEFYTRFHISVSPTKIVSKEEKFGLSKNQLEGLSQWGCIGYFHEDDKSGNSGGKEWTDLDTFALLLKAMDNGLDEMTLKFGEDSEKFTIGNSKLIFSNEETQLRNGDTKWIKQISITKDGRNLRFKARCQVMDADAGSQLKSYRFIETDSNGLYQQCILDSDFPGEAPFYTRFHLTLLK